MSNKPFYPKNDLFEKAKSEVYKELFKSTLDKIHHFRQEAANTGNGRKTIELPSPGKSPKFSSVQEKVKEMQARAGVGKISAQKKQDLLKRLANLVVTAGYEEDDKINEKPRIFEAFPQIKLTLNNIITDTGGLLPIPAVLDRLRTIHRNDITDDELWNDERLMKYISKENLNVKQEHSDPQIENPNLGKIKNYQQLENDPLQEADDMFSSFHGKNI